MTDDKNALVHWLVPDQSLTDAVRQVLGDVPRPVPRTLGIVVSAGAASAVRVTQIRHANPALAAGVRTELANFA